MGNKPRGKKYIHRYNPGLESVLNKLLIALPMTNSINLVAICLVNDAQAMNIGPLLMAE